MLIGERGQWKKGLRLPIRLVRGEGGMESDRERGEKVNYFRTHLLIDLF